jgi:purine-nucleoside phosphorylase
VSVPGPGDGFDEKGLALLREMTDSVPTTGVILGSGLGDALAGMETEVSLPYTGLPGFPEPSVPGHEGRIALGRMSGVSVAAFFGRIHFYEGHPLDLVTLPVRLVAALGARTLVVTAAVGALDPELAPGSLVVSSDHINFLGENPLRGWRDEVGTPPFVDMTEAYDRELAVHAVKAADDVGLPATQGVYAAMPGPTYETPAEVRFLRGSGATVVGMSVVPEVCAARALGLRCLGLFCVTNRVGVAVDHDEVTTVASTFAGHLGRLLERLLPEV